MDYKEKYEQALEKARVWKEKSGMPKNKQGILDDIFPELKESEDERISKKIIKYLERTIPHHHRDEVLKSKEWIAWLEKQGDANKEYWRGYREGKKEILDKYSELEKQSEQKVSYTTTVETGNGGINALVTRELPTNGCDEQKPVDKVEPKFKVKYAGNEYNVFETKEIAGVTFYGIEDEPKHIDYVKAENCEIISGGYGIKENGCSFPTNPIIFSEQKSAWSEKDEKMLEDIMSFINHESVIEGLKCRGIDYSLSTSARIMENSINWLKSLKQRIGG